MAQELMIRPEPTPNPGSVRFVINQPVLERGTADFISAEQAESSPLARQLFKLPAVSGVLLGPNFVTVTALGEVNWRELAPQVAEKIHEHIESGEPFLTGPVPEIAARPENEVAEGIVRIIEQEIRPAVAMDGGDVLFGGFENGIVHLHLRGACSGCPSATMTLKMGIERRLQESFPEVLAVEAI